MSNAPSTYDVEDSSPPQNRRFRQAGGYTTMNDIGTNESTTHRLQVANGAPGKLKHRTARLSPLPPPVAPVANMRRTPPRDQLLPLNTPASNDSNTSKCKPQRNSAPDTNALEAPEDRRESDGLFVPETTIPSSSHYRKRKADTDPPSSAAALAATDSRSGARKGAIRNRLYNRCTKPTKNQRKHHLSLIRSNWGREIRAWMPPSLMPAVRGKSSKRVPLEDPKDWSTTLLHDLAYLSGKMVSEPQKAYRALEDAVAVRDEGSQGGQLVPGDVRYAIEQIEKKEPSTTTRAPQLAEAAKIATRVIDNHITNSTQPDLHDREPAFEHDGSTSAHDGSALDSGEPTSEGNESAFDRQTAAFLSSGLPFNNNEMPYKLPSPRTPSRLAPPIRIKQEVPFGTVWRSIEATSTPDAGSADVFEVHDGFERQWQRVRKKRRLENEREENRLKQENLRIQRELWALNDEDEVE